MKLQVNKIKIFRAIFGDNDLSPEKYSYIYRSTVRWNKIFSQPWYA